MGDNLCIAVLYEFGMTLSLKVFSIPPDLKGMKFSGMLFIRGGKGIVV